MFKPTFTFEPEDKDEIIADCVMVCFDYNPKKDNPVLIVGRETNGRVVRIINSFEGEEAKELYYKLINVKGKGKRNVIY